MRRRVAVIFDNFGPYHEARIKAASAFMEVIPVELNGASEEYGWKPVSLVRITLQSMGQPPLPNGRMISRLSKILSATKPDVVAVNGWSHKGAMAALYWCMKSGVPAIVMSESAEGDDLRIGWKEKIKKQIIRHFSAGLVGGSRHESYLKGLGMNSENIFRGYDVVDNTYFFDSVETHRRCQHTSSSILEGKRYFLVSSRFIYKKNLPLILKAYAEYRKLATEQVFDLVIMGDGPLRPFLELMVKEMELEEYVHLPGFIQYDELPLYYANAIALVHASTIEQWGLVVNEAMASGLPVLVSENCGCAPELVSQGFNGYTFNPLVKKQLTELLLKLSERGCGLDSMGANSRTIINDWHPSFFGKGLAAAVEKALAQTKKRSRWHELLLVKSLAYNFSNPYK